MNAGDRPEQDSKVAKHSNTKSVERLVKRSIKVSNSDHHSSATWATTSVNYESVAEIAECTNTSKSCDEQNTSIQKNEYDQDCNLQNSDLDGTGVQEISTQEHIESLDIDQVSNVCDQV